MGGLHYFKWEAIWLQTLEVGTRVPLHGFKSYSCQLLEFMPSKVNKYKHKTATTTSNNQTFTFSRLSNLLLMKLIDAIVEMLT